MHLHTLRQRRPTMAVIMTTTASRVSLATGVVEEVMKPLIRVAMGGPRRQIPTMRRHTSPVTAKEAEMNTEDRPIRMMTPILMTTRSATSMEAAAMTLMMITGRAVNREAEGMVVGKSNHPTGNLRTSNKGTVNPPLRDMVPATETVTIPLAPNDSTLGAVAGATVMVPIQTTTRSTAADTVTEDTEHGQTCNVRNGRVLHKNNAMDLDKLDLWQIYGV